MYVTYTVFAIQRVLGLNPCQTLTRVCQNQSHVVGKNKRGRMGCGGGGGGCVAGTGWGGGGGGGVEGGREARPTLQIKKKLHKKFSFVSVTAT